MTKKLGYLRTCMDRRFVQKTRDAFEKHTGLTPVEYWHESYPGGSALDTPDTGVNYAVDHGASIIGWQAHGSKCGGQPGVEDQTIQDRLAEVIKQMKQKFPYQTHLRIYVTDDSIDIREV